MSGSTTRGILIILLVDQGRQTALLHLFTMEHHWFGVLTVSTKLLHALLQNKSPSWIVDHVCGLATKDINHCKETDDDSIISTNWFEKKNISCPSKCGLQVWKRNMGGAFAMGDQNRLWYIFNQC